MNMFAKTFFRDQHFSCSADTSNLTFTFILQAFLPLSFIISFRFYFFQLPLLDNSWKPPHKSPSVESFVPRVLELKKYDPQFQRYLRGQTHFEIEKPLNVFKDPGALNLYKDSSLTLSYCSPARLGANPL